MGRTWWAAGLVGGLIASAPGRAGDPDWTAGYQRLEPVIRQAQDKKDPPKEAPKAKEMPKAKEPPPKPKDVVVEPDAFVRATDMSGEAPAGSFSRMMGDLVGGMYADTFITVPAIQVTSSTLFTTQSAIQTVQGPNGELIRVLVTFPVPNGTITNVQQTLVTTRAQVPIIGRGAFKIAENERPLPEDRFILTYNYFNQVPGAILGPGPTVAGLAPPGDSLAVSIPPTTVTQIGGPPQLPKPTPGAAAAPVAVAVQTATFNGSPVVIRTLVPNPDLTVHRGVVGFEKTLFDGMASIGVRAPYLHQGGGDGSLSADDFGDLTFVFKYLALTNGTDGLSVGLAVTAPTGPAIPTVVGNIHSTLLQPFVGGLMSFGDFFAMGFSSVLIPTDSRDVTILFNDIGVGFLAYRGGPDSAISFIAPVSEVHVTTPLENRHGGGVIRVPDLVVLTEGVQIGFGPAALNLGIGIPVTGPRPFNFEGMVQFNLRY
jgi:hypothetical protein